jgi:putative redox protein
MPDIYFTALNYTKLSTLNVTTLHRGAFTFESNVNNHTLFMDADEELGGNDYGPTPVETLLASLNSCLGICIVNLLNKKNIPYHDFTINATAAQATTAPKVLQNIVLKFTISITEEHQASFKDLVQLAHEKYCIISQLVHHSVSIQNEFLYN